MFILLIKFKTNIVYSNYFDASTPWIIITNKHIEIAVQNYSFRLVSSNVCLKIKNLMVLILIKFLL